MGKSAGGARLRSRLLVGVAAAAMAVPLAGNANAQTAPSGAKWSPYVEAGGMVGTRSFGDVDIFLPLWQDQGSLLFGDLRGTFSAQPTEEGNFGLGYRTQISPEWILGGYGYFDIANSPNDNLFYQVTLGVELKSVDWDFRLNGYIPINPDGGSVQKNGNAQIRINGNTIQMQTESRDEKALYGFDGEVGWRVPILPADSNVDVRVYAGGYYFTNSDVDTIAGPRGRIEVRLYDIDFLGLQSRLTAQGVVQWDSPRGVQGFGGLELRIPLGAITGETAPKLSPLDRRMVDRVQRDVDIVTEKTNPDKQNEDVIVDELTVSTHTIVFANGPGGGNGTQGSPKDLQNAPAFAPGLNGGTGSNAIIVADGAAGNIGVTNPLQLLPGQALIGGGSIVALHGARTGKTVDFSFAGTHATLSGTNTTANLVQMAGGSQNEVFGLAMTGAMYNAVAGVNMERAIVKDSLIDPPTGNGLFFVQEATASYGGPQPSSFVHIEGNTVLGAGEAGIAVVDLVSDGSAHAQTVIIDHNTVASAAGNGIEIVTGASGSGTAMSQSLAVRYNVISDNGTAFVVSALAKLGVDGNGILIANAAYSGSTLSQSVAIAANTITGHPYAGISLSNRIGTAGTVGQAVVIADNTITQASRAGIVLYSFASGAGAALSQSIDIESNRIDGIGTGLQESATGIYIKTNVYAFASATQSVTIAHNVVSGVVASGYGFGILVTNSIYSAGASQTLLIEHNTVAGVSAFDFVAGIDVANYLTGLAATLSADQAILSNRVSDISAVLIPTVSSTPVFGLSAFGIVAVNVDRYGAISQSLTIASNAVASVSSGAYAFGIALGNNISLQGASLGQSAAILNNSVSGIGAAETAGGIVFSNVAYYGGIIHSQQVTIAGNLVSGIASDIRAFGIIAVNNATSLDASISQSLVISDNIVSDTVGSLTAAGIVVANAAYLGVISQALDLSRNTVSLVSYNALSNAGGVGIVLFNSASSATILQDLPISANSVTDVGGDAIRLENHVVYGVVSQAGTITRNQASGNGGIGLGLYNSAVGADASGFVSLSITNNNFSFDDAGVDSVATAAGGAIVDLHASLNGNTIDNNTTDGIFVFASGAGATEAFSLGTSDNVNFNTGFGVHLLTIGGGVISFITDGATITGNSLGNIHTGP